MSESFGECLRRMRLATIHPRRVYGDRRLGVLSQSELAELSEFDHSYVSRLESGSRMPTREAVDRLADAMGLTDDDRGALVSSAGFLTSANAYLTDPDCIALAQLLTSTQPERGEWIRATVRNLIAMNVGGMG